MKNTVIDEAQADAMRARVMAAPQLVIETGDGEETAYRVKRVGFLPPLDDPTPFLETEGGELYRLPVELTAWAVDLVGMALALDANPFPCVARFGIVHDRYWADLD